MNYLVHHLSQSLSIFSIFIFMRFLSSLSTDFKSNYVELFSSSNVVIDLQVHLRLNYYASFIFIFFFFKFTKQSVPPNNLRYVYITYYTYYVKQGADLLGCILNTIIIEKKAPFNYNLMNSFNG